MELSFLSTVFLVLFIIFRLFHLQHYAYADDERYEECNKPFECGTFSNLSYPFYGGTARPDYCGYPGFQLNCRSSPPDISVTLSERYYVIGVKPDQPIITVARKDYWDGYCPGNLHNTSINCDLFSYVDLDNNVTFYYGCPNVSMPMTNSFTCPNSRSDPRTPFGYFVPKGLESSTLGRNIRRDTCNRSITVPIINYESSALRIVDTISLMAALRYGKSGTKPAVIIGLSVGGAIVAAALLCCSIFAVRRRRQSLAQDQSKDLGPSNPSNGLPTTATSNEYRYSQGYTTSPSTNLSQSLPSYPSSKSEFENSADYLGVKVFAYNELEEATEHFHESRELGDGGFGTVYYGKLNDGRLVAVKRLYENSCRHMGQFMNEIQILARLRHKNLVALYGCTSRRSRELLLVYEYISNGTVADHLHGKLAQSNVLRWSTRLSIAVETAEALSFLHENEVIHRDVKTTNILLDDSFKVKVADFGLSRLFPDNVTHVSTAPQGTPGYVDPEYYQCYQLTEKSDVYSFGVVLAELISSKVAVDITRHRHDINLANMAVDRIQKHAFTELVDPKLWCEKDHLAQKMVKLVSEVAFQCLQQEKEARPSMKEVLESLKGIQKELDNSQIQVVVDIHENDDVGLLKNVPPPVSPETEPSK
uniref:Protein kinase domain-containing protein n=1 Tax=Chenopodium quinoa TaxID=63459 RepID=A0A803M4A9_CHEQI